MGGDWKSIPKEFKPHWSSWKIDGTPLETTQKKLHAIGLHDPWIRNEVWVYRLPKEKTSFVKTVLTRGMFSGFAVFLGLLAVKNIFFAKKGGHDSHH